MKIDISKKQQLTVETFTGNAHGGKAFTGIRFRLGKVKPKTLFHFHHGKAYKIIEAIKTCLESVPDEGGFYESPQWQKLRYETLRKYRKCCLCGSNENLHVDHIKPRSKFPTLELDADNLQVLCKRCNLAKLNHDCDDYREN